VLTVSKKVIKSTSFTVQEAARRAMPVERLHQEAEAKFNRIKVSSTCAVLKSGFNQVSGSGSWKLRLPQKRMKNFHANYL
jgi:hypothetical protein